MNSGVFCAEKCCVDRLQWMGHYSWGKCFRVQRPADWKKVFIEHFHINEISLPSYALGRWKWSVSITITFWGKPRLVMVNAIGEKSRFLPTPSNLWFWWIVGTSCTVFPYICSHLVSDQGLAHLISQWEKHQSAQLKLILPAVSSVKEIADWGSILIPNSFPHVDFSCARDSLHDMLKQSCYRLVNFLLRYNLSGFFLSYPLSPMPVIHCNKNCTAYRTCNFLLELFG